MNTRNGNPQVLVETKPCPVCGEATVLKVSAFDFYRWQGGMLAQQAFPEMTTEQRELLMTGTHGRCWESMFKQGEKGSQG